MQKITSSLSLLRGFLLLIYILVLVIVNSWLPVSGTTKSQDRAVTKFRNGKLPMPLEIKAIKTKKKVAKIGETISDDED